MASTDTTFAMARLASKVQTVGQARAVLGKTAELLRDGYSKLDTLTNLGGLRDGYRDSLDIANAYAQGVYAIYSGATPDLYDEEISIQNAARVGLSLERARKILVEIEDAAEVQWWDIVAILQEALNAVQSAITWTAGTLAKTAAAVAAPIVSTFWPWLLAIAVGLFFYFRFKGRVLTALTGGT